MVAHRADTEELLPGMGLYRRVHFRSRVKQKGLHWYDCRSDNLYGRRDIVLKYILICNEPSGRDLREFSCGSGGHLACPGRSEVRKKLFCHEHPLLTCWIDSSWMVLPPERWARVVSAGAFASRTRRPYARDNATIRGEWTA